MPETKSKKRRRREKVAVRNLDAGCDEKKDKRVKQAEFESKDCRRDVGHPNDDKKSDDDLGRHAASSSKTIEGKPITGKGILKDGVTLLLFYQYVEPPWTTAQHKEALRYVRESGERLSLGGRMRVAREGLNCTLTGTFQNVRQWCRELRHFCPKHFSQTEFKLTDNLPTNQSFPQLNVFPVDELVHYGLGGDKAPSLSLTGDHLEPEEYHKKMAEKDTVIIDVRNHYEAAIGHFRPPPTGAELVDPKMRKSTEFPLWLDRPETKKKLRGKQVLMYCTGGVRCERASALLRAKLKTDEDMKDLRVKGVYQLQGGIDKYFKKIPDGGFWVGKNYVFDKRFAHSPPKIESEQHAAKNAMMGNCEACGKSWDMYRGKRRCPTCGVPSLICRACLQADADGTRKLDKSVRCKLCVEEGIYSKSQIKKRESAEFDAYEARQREKRISQKSVKQSDNGIQEQTTWIIKDDTNATRKQIETPLANPEGITRLYVGNLCIKKINEDILSEALPGVTHVQWLNDHKTGKFRGSCFVEMATPEDAAFAVARDGAKVLGRAMKVRFQKPDFKDIWPSPAAIKIE